MDRIIHNSYVFPLAKNNMRKILDNEKLNILISELESKKQTLKLI